MGVYEANQEASNMISFSAIKNFLIARNRAELLIGAAVILILGYWLFG